MKRFGLVSIVLPAALVLGLAVAGWFWGRPAWRGYQEQRSLAQARKFVDRQDFRSASLSLRSALLANPENLEACRLMAELADEAGSPQALDWFRRLVERSPTPEHQLRLAAAGLRYESPPFRQTAEVLEQLRPATSNQASFHVLSAELALKQKRPAGAIAGFATAASLEPSNPWHRLNLAALNLQSADARIAAEARSTLDTLSTQDGVGPAALRWLVVDWRRSMGADAALPYSQRLVAAPEATLEDRLQHLELLGSGPDAAPFLVETQRRAAEEPTQILRMVSWMLNHGFTNQAAAWLSELAPEMRDQQPVRMARVSCLVASCDWAGLENELEGAAWGEWDFMRLAFLSRAASGQNQAQATELRWRQAVREAGERPGPVASLVNLALTWERREAAEQLLRQMARRPAVERWALGELDRLYADSGNTRELHRIHSRLIELDPGNVVARNNYAATSLLLGLDLERACEMARQLRSEHPEDPVIASTYAFSLHLQGCTAEGLTALEGLPAEVLEQPGLALYYGVLLSATGQTNQVDRYLALASSASLLPEERLLLERASHR